MTRISNTTFRLKYSFWRLRIEVFIIWINDKMMQIIYSDVISSIENRNREFEPNQSSRAIIYSKLILIISWLKDSDTKYELLCYKGRF